MCHTHAVKAGAIGRLALRLPASVIVHTFHGHVFPSFFNPLKTRFFYKCRTLPCPEIKRHYCISNARRRKLVHDFRFAPEASLPYSRLGLDLDAFATGQEEKRKRFRAEFGWLMMKSPSALSGAWCR
jgi:hypothetical protein